MDKNISFCFIGAAIFRLRYERIDCGENEYREISLGRDETERWPERSVETPPSGSAAVGPESPSLVTVHNDSDGFEHLSSSVES